MKDKILDNLSKRCCLAAESVNPSYTFYSALYPCSIITWN